MNLDRAARRRRTGRRLVRSWFAVMALIAIALAGVLVYDFGWGELISHVGLQAPLSLAALLLVIAGIVLLPLLIAGVILGRRAGH